jgi:hypothetical protein
MGMQSVMSGVMDGGFSSLAQFGGARDSSVGLSPIVWLGLIFAVLLVLLFATIFTIRQYKRCPSNRILVIYG